MPQHEEQATLVQTVEKLKGQLSLALRVLQDLGFDPDDFADATA